MATGTGRLSTAAPNLQSLPKVSDVRMSELKNSVERLGDKGVAVRRAFVCGAGHCMVSVDYRQIEMRIFAHCSHDPQLSVLFHQQGKSDIYSVIAAYILGKEQSDVSKQERDQAKVITLVSMYEWSNRQGLCYGMGVDSMARKLNITMETATKLRTGILTRFSGLQRFIDSTMQSARAKHYVETLAGRRRSLEANMGEDKTRSDRQAVNSVIQGSAADLLKCAMILLWPQLEKLGCEICVQIHDELIIDCPDDPDLVKQVVEMLQRVMCDEAKKELQRLYRLNHPEVTYEFEVPLEQSVQIGKNMSFSE